jgi:hypothetical protein
VFEGAKTVHALDRAATVIGLCDDYVYVLVYDTKIINIAKLLYSASEKRNRCGVNVDEKKQTHVRLL